jgi:hypothetical protein
MSRKVIITCAVTGAIHTPSMSPHLPVTAKEIAGQLKGVSSKPRYGLLDSAYYDTSAQSQGAYMSNIDDLIKGLGY